MIFIVPMLIKCNILFTFIGAKEKEDALVLKEQGTAGTNEWSVGTTDQTMGTTGETSGTNGQTMGTNDQTVGTSWQTITFQASTLIWILYFYFLTINS